MSAPLAVPPDLAPTHTPPVPDDYDSFDGDECPIPIEAGRGCVPLTAIPDAWCQDRRLSLAALGLVVRIASAMWTRGERRIPLSNLLDDLDDSAGLLAEIRAAGYIRDGNVFEDPFAVYWTPPDASIPPQRRAAPDVVYYVRRQDGSIKIGTTQHLEKRLRGLKRLFGEIELLATEPGVKSLETDRHQTFADLRRRDLAVWEGTEWFRPGPALLAHIESLAGDR